MRSATFRKILQQGSPAELAAELNPVPPLVGGLADLKIAPLALLQYAVDLAHPGKGVTIYTSVATAGRRIPLAEHL